MKLSICMTYYNRRELLINTLISIQKFVKNFDVEILIVDDASDEQHKINDLPEKFQSLNIIIHRFEPEEKWWSLQIPPHNKLIAMATGDIIIQQGAECYHVNDIISDAILNTKDNDYRVYGCYALTEEDTKNINNLNYHIKINNDFNVGTIFELGGWYQHSIYSDRHYNFCTAITKKDLLELGGFDERFSKGIAFGDDEFITRIKRKKMNVISVDDFFVYHQFHELTKHRSDDPNLELFLNILKNEDKIKVHNSFLN